MIRSLARFSLCVIAAFAVAAVPLIADAGGGNGQQGGQITTSIDVQLTVLPLCTGLAVVGGNKIDFGSYVPSTAVARKTFQVTYNCASGALPRIAFLSRNGCNLVADHPSEVGSNKISYQIDGPTRNQLACSPGELNEKFCPLRSSPATFTAVTQPLLDPDPRVSGLGTFGDTVIATVDF